MSKIGEFIAWKLNQVFPPLAIHHDLRVAKSSTEANQQWAYKEAQRVVEYFEPYWDVRGKNILDIGTGLGGKLPFYVESGAESVTGIDINPNSVEISYQYIIGSDLTNNNHEIVRLAVSDASSLPFDDNSFDAIISINVYEHIIPLEEAIKEAYRVLKPRGIAYLHLPPYYSPWGPHLENWIHFPWPHLIFSDKTLINTATKEDKKFQISDQFVQAAQVDWKSTHGEIPNVNRVTLHRFRRLLLQAGFEIVHLRLLSVGYDSLRKNESRINRIAYLFLIAASKLPLIQEMIVTKMVYILQKV